MFHILVMILTIIWRFVVLYKASCIGNFVTISEVVLVCITVIIRHNIILICCVLIIVLFKIGSCVLDDSF